MKQDDILTYVDPFIGTGFHGHTFPGATLPFGMVQLSPDTHLDGWDASSGYHYDDSLIYAFSHTHLSGTGIGDLGDVACLPFSNSTEQIPVAEFDKESESATPGYYKVTLSNFDVDVELTATLRVGLHKYSFNNSSDRNIMLNLAHILQPSWGGRVEDNSFEIIDEKTIQGVRKTADDRTFLNEEDSQDTIPCCVLANVVRLHLHTAGIGFRSHSHIHPRRR